MVFTPPFKECIRLARKESAKSGNFMSFDDAAYRVMSDAIESIEKGEHVPPRPLR